MREASHQIRHDVRGASPYVAALMRLLADRLDSVGRGDADALAAIGIALAVVGEHMRDAALRTS